MSMLDRYRKTGGFVQLLILLETCGPQKQQKFLELIRAEDPRWADAVQKKLLDIHRIFTWSDETIAEIVGTLQDLTVAVALHGLSPTEAAKVRKTFTHARSRKIEDLFATNKPTPNEVNTMFNRILEEVRKMVKDGYLRFEKVDPSLAIDDDIEALIEKGELPDTPKADGHEEPHTDGTTLNFDMAVGLGGNDHGMTGDQRQELVALKKKVADLGKDNAQLRHEVSVLKNKLEQIRKIA